MLGRVLWSEYKDSNLGPSGPKPDALPGCATLRLCMERVGRVELRDLQLGRLLDAPCPVYPQLFLDAWPRNRTGPLGYEPNVLPSHSPAIVFTILKHTTKTSFCTKHSDYHVYPIVHVMCFRIVEH